MFIRSCVNGKDKMSRQSRAHRVERDKITWAWGFKNNKAVKVPLTETFCKKYCIENPEYTYCQEAGIWVLNQNADLVNFERLAATKIKRIGQLSLFGMEGGHE